MSQLCACGLCSVAVKPGRRFARGHNMKQPPRYTVDVDTGCWLWAGGLAGCGYARYKSDGDQQAHVYFYERVNGPVPDGLELDHLCHVRHCVNPEHLEPVTHAENTRRRRDLKLNAEVVRSMRQRYEESALPKRTFARLFADEYGVAFSTMRAVLSGRLWAGV